MQLVDTHNCEKTREITDGGLLVAWRILTNDFFLKECLMNSKIPGKPQVTPHEPEETASRRDPRSATLLMNTRCAAKCSIRRLPTPSLPATLHLRSRIQAVTMLSV